MKEDDAATKSSEWPKKAALYNPLARSSFELYFQKKLDLSKVSTISGGREVEIFRHIVSVMVCDAVLVVSPWVEILDGKEGADAVKLKMRIGDCGVIFSKHLTSFPGSPDFGGCPLDPEKDTFEAREVGSGGRLGLFTPNGDDIRITTYGLLDSSPPVKLKIGLIAAEYTTKPEATRSPMR